LVNVEAKRKSKIFILYLTLGAEANCEAVCPASQLAFLPPVVISCGDGLGKHLISRCTKPKTAGCDFIIIENLRGL
jgi:hypothetical protein